MHGHSGSGNALADTLPSLDLAMVTTVAGRDKHAT
jgi:hypothetical protein